MKSSISRSAAKDEGRKGAWSESGDESLSEFRDPSEGALECPRSSIPLHSSLSESPFG